MLIFDSRVEYMIICMIVKYPYSVVRVSVHYSVLLHSLHTSIILFILSAESKKNKIRAYGKEVI